MKSYKVEDISRLLPSLLESEEIYESIYNYNTSTFDDI